MATKTKKEHFVPQSYLTRFATSGKFWVFDKVENRIYRANIEDVAEQRYFYDLPIDLEEFGVDIQIAEKAFAKEEGNFRIAIDHILDHVEHQEITRQQRHKLCPHLVMQWLRTRECRETLMEIATKFTQALVNELTRRNYPDISPDRYPKVVFSKDSAKVYHYDHMFKNPRLPEITRTFLDYIWLIEVNNTTQPLYTSDNPIIRQAHVNTPFMDGGGIYAKGVEFIYPLTPKFTLLLQERTHFKANECYEGKTIEIDKQDIDRFNMLNIIQCSRQIFCNEQKLEFAQNFWSQYAGRLSKPKERFNVTIQPVKGKKNRDYIILQERLENFSL